MSTTKVYCGVYTSFQVYNYVCLLLLRATKTSSKETAGSFSKKEEENHVPPQCVMDFFAKAGSGKNFSDGLPSLSNYANTQSTQTPALKVGSNEAMLHKLMASPIHTVEQIEMQQRSATPKVDILATTPSEKSKPIKQCSLNNIKPRSLFNQKSQAVEEDISHINHNGFHRPKENKETSHNRSPVEQFLNRSVTSMKYDMAVGKYTLFCVLN